MGNKRQRYSKGRKSMKSKFSEHKQSINQLESPNCVIRYDKTKYMTSKNKPKNIKTQANKILEIKNYRDIKDSDTLVNTKTLALKLSDTGMKFPKSASKTILKNSWRKNKRVDSFKKRISYSKSKYKIPKNMKNI